MFSLLAMLLRLVSRAACLVVLASFAIFVVHQTSKASTHQQEEVHGAPAAETKSAGHESGLHKTIDKVAKKLTSPFSGITSGSSSQWVIRGVGTLMALLVYGIGLGFVARVLRVRV
jgi:hypothetical protein